MREEKFDARIKLAADNTVWNGPLQCDGFHRGTNFTRESWCAMYDALETVKHESSFHTKEVWNALAKADKILKGEE